MLSFWLVLAAKSGVGGAAGTLANGAGGIVERLHGPSSCSGGMGGAGESGGGSSCWGASSGGGGVSGWSDRRYELYISTSPGGRSRGAPPSSRSPARTRAL